MSDLTSERTRPLLGAEEWAVEETFMIRTVLEGEVEAVLRSKGIRSWVKRAWPRWFIPNWIS